jgi:hypothetical protein
MGDNVIANTGIKDFDLNEFMSDFRESAAERGLEIASSRDVIPMDTPEYARAILESTPSIKDQLAQKESEQTSTGNASLDRLADHVESLGGMQALETIAQVMNSDVSEAKKMVALLSPETQQELAWEILNNVDDNVIFNDSEVRSRVAQAFGVASIDQINQALAFWEKNGGRLIPAKSEAEFQQMGVRSQAFENDFFKGQRTLEVVRHYNDSFDYEKSLDLLFGAQGRFISQHGAEFSRLQSQAANGIDTTIQSARLQNAWLATLIQNTFGNVRLSAAQVSELSSIIA